MQLRARIRFRAAGIYRDLLERESTPAFRLMMLGAAVFDRLTDVARRLADVRREVPRIQRRTVSAGVRFTHRDVLTVSGAAIGGPDQLSVRFTGPTASLDRVTTLWLVRVGDGHAVDLAAAVSVTGDLVRGAAVVPHAMFAADGSSWRIAAGDGRTEIGTVVADRSVVIDRWADDAGAWPPRLGVDDDHHLIVTGSAPAGRVVEHRIVVGLVTATIEWTGEPDVPGALRLHLRDSSESIEVEAAPGPSGGQRAVVELGALVARGDGVWRASVRSSADVDRWDPLQLRRGAYPALADLPAVAELPVRRTDGSTAQVRIAYSGSNRLTFAVRAMR